MLWPNTGRIIAVMTDEHAFGDRAKVHFPGDTVCPVRITIPAADPQMPIPVLVSDAFPKPTAIGLLDVAPETLCEVVLWGLALVTEDIAVGEVSVTMDGDVPATPAGAKRRARIRLHRNFILSVPRPGRLQPRQGLISLVIITYVRERACLTCG